MEFHFVSPRSVLDPEGAKRRTLFDLDVDELEYYIQYFGDPNFDINAQEEGTGLTLLHYAAARAWRRIFLALLATGRCDLTIRDRWGRTAAAVAHQCDNLAMSRMLLYKEMQQRLKAQQEAQGQTPPEPPPSEA